MSFVSNGFHYSMNPNTLTSASITRSATTVYDNTDIIIEFETFNALPDGEVIQIELSQQMVLIPGAITCEREIVGSYVPLACTLNTNVVEFSSSGE